MQVASALNVSRWTIYRLIEEGALTALRVGRQHRIRPEVVTAYQRENESRASTAAVA
jgi:excisionase family DNA binding protein